MIERIALLPVYRLALGLLSVRVPRAGRREWRAEWIAELWYVWEAAAERESLMDRHREIVAFCEGAVEDARCLRNQHPMSSVKASGSAVACCVLLSVVAMMTIGLAHVIPGVKRAMRVPVYRGASHVVTISSTTQVSTVPLGAVRSLERKPQHLFSDLAFYEEIRRPIHLAEGLSPVFSVGRASENFLDVLGVPVWFRQQAKTNVPMLILSESAWRREFGASPAIFGATVRLGVQLVRIGGVIPETAAPAGREFDAWILMPGQVAGGLGDETPVFLVGRLAAFGEGAVMRRPSWEMSVPKAEGADEYHCAEIASPPLETMEIFLFTVFLAILALPATTSLSLGDYAVHPSSLPWTRAPRRWLFLAAKIGLGLPAIYFGSLDLTFAVAWNGPSAPQYAQLAISFSATLFLLRWALRDQRSRCPECLGKLSCPARVGQPSRNFLAWNGTELICVGGHGLLHVPELPTSWCGTQRWLPLDPSWSGLFFGPA